MRVVYPLLLTLITTILAAGQVHAQQTGEWLHLFDEGSLFGWTALGEGNWHVDEGAIICSAGSGGMLATTSQFQNFELTAEIRLKENCTSGIVFRSPLDGHPHGNGAGVMWLDEPRGSGSPWRTVHIIAQGGTVTATLDGEAAEVHAGEHQVGHIGILYHHNNDALLAVRKVQLRPLGLAAIFNGENLDGWNILPGHQSKFNVVDGAINITDGNGQIETADTYKNFLLQLDIISNGEHLNSGVFFRGPVGVFWKGYESQVRNQWARNDRSRPVDYGTGGIYGNQAARMVVPNDYEWFTKTIVVNDNHMAVWINGYQVSDFLDTRPVNPNGDGKAGYVPDAGTIHLQGHDPTTDLSFKNIVIQEYPD